MAAAFVTTMSSGGVVVRSAGSAPAADLNPLVVDAMAEVGIDLREMGAAPKRLDEETVRASDVVITMGCGDSCPIFPGQRHEDWVFDDPAGADIAGVRRIRDQIRARVEELMTSLGVTA